MRRSLLQQGGEYEVWGEDVGVEKSGWLRDGIVHYYRCPMRAFEIVLTYIA
jgi:hypothetical protein